MDVGHFELTQTNTIMLFNIYLLMEKVEFHSSVRLSDISQPHTNEDWQIGIGLYTVLPS